jgi:glycerate dehydrogenase
MKIVVLDGYTTNPGDLDWSDLRELGEVTIHDRTAPADILPRIGQAEIILTNKTVLDAAVIAQLPAVEYIGLMSTGTNAVDLDAAGEAGIVVTNVPAYSTDSVAQLTFALLLEHCHHTAEHAESVRRGDWARSEDFCYWNHPLIELAGQTMGIVGYGAIGQAVARIARAFGMEVLVHTRTPRDEQDVRFVGIEELLAGADVVSLNCPLTPETENLINADSLATMKPSAILINTGRGGLVDEQAVADALAAGKLGGFAADVLSTEPPAAENPLPAAPNTFITPHIAWATQAARQRLIDTLVANIRAFQQGQPQNVVNQ